MSLQALSTQHEDLPPLRTPDLLPTPTLPARPPRLGALVPARAGAAPRTLFDRAVEAAGLEAFVRLARVYPALFQGMALPIGALLVMCLVMGGLPTLVVGAYFLGCGMILSRKAVKSLLDQAPAQGGQQPA